MFALSVTVIITVVAAARSDHASLQHDQCIDDAYARFHARLTTLEFQEYENFTSALPSSRHAFGLLLAQSFTPEVLNEYCQTYKTAFSEYNGCKNSTYKTVVLKGFGLINYICTERLNDYAYGLQCLQKADSEASGVCKPKCAQYEDASHSYLSPTESQLQGDMVTFMAGDCLFLWCWTECRRPILERQCGNRSTALEFDALVASYTALHDLYQPKHGLALATDATFPTECNVFVANLSPAEVQKQSNNASNATLLDTASDNAHSGVHQQTSVHQASATTASAKMEAGQAVSAVSRMQTMEFYWMMLTIIVLKIHIL